MFSRGEHVRILGEHTYSGKPKSSAYKGRVGEVYDTRKYKGRLQVKFPNYFADGSGVIAKFLISDLESVHPIWENDYCQCFGKGELKATEVPIDL